MKTYVATTGIVFALLVVAHVWRVIAEGPGVLNVPWIAITAAAAGLSVWAAVLVRRSSRG